MRTVDDVVLDALRATGLNVHDGYVTVDADTKVVSYPVPYVIFTSSIGSEETARLTGRHTMRSVFFSVTYVGLDRNQAKAAGERARGALHGKRLTVPGHKAGLCYCDRSVRVRRDDDAIRPDGMPLFYGVDDYSLSVTQTPTI